MIDVVWQKTRIPVIYWNWKHPQENGVITVGTAIIKMSRDVKQCTEAIQEALSNTEQDPYYTNFTLTHIILPHIPDWVLEGTLFSACIYFRGFENETFTPLDSMHITGY